ncbi:MAG: glycine--tRNA ligase subunit beta [Alphaproteobacteria bacterium HGW-Alphaproteobacteria-7]|nr:MAG: glycine--tRNA ligase subunit beta [Alphaproteobacteria bacterium HGW-Alphaproteobacteria-7]
MSDFLLELRCEEIPARMQAGARAELEKLFRRELDAAGVAVGELTIWSTPRRLALIVRGLPLATEAVSEEAKGPPEGAPDAAIDGFCRKAGVERAALELRDIKGRMTYFAVIEQPGRAMADVLAAAIPAIIRDFSWPKSMRWGAASIATESLRWVRPLSGIVALLDGEVVPCEVGGIASGRETAGHRFHHEGLITIGNADDYAEKLRACHVIVDHEERAAIIRNGAAQAAADAGLTLVADEGLVIENAGLTEWPVPLLGRFDEAFLDVPPEVIQLTARVNQKYFVATRAPAQAGASGSGAQSTEVPACAGTHILANAFICTANIDAIDPAVVVDGNRKVLAARLSDARFFWEQDQKKTLAEHAKGLSRITFHEKLGTVADKVDRVAKLARWLVESDIVTPAQAGVSGRSARTPEMPASAGMTKNELANMAEQAARLCKADLVTEMVGEFPELQGLMGGYYAAKEGLPQEVAAAIRDHYKPVGQGDDVPTAPVTVAVSLADKLDTLVGFFAIDERPTGSKDPFALRRAALAIIELILSAKVTTSFRELISEDYRLHALGLVDRHPSLASDPLDGGFLSELLSPSVLVNGPAYLSRSLEIWALRDKPPLLSALLDEAGSPMWCPDQIRKTGGVRFEFVGFVDVVNAVNEYVFERLRERSRREGIRPDLIDALLPKGVRIDNRKIKIELPGLEPSQRHLTRKFFYFPNVRLQDDVSRVVVLAEALQAFVTTEDGANLLAGYKRAANILKKENYPPRDGEGDRPQGGGGDSAASAGIGGKSPPSAAAPLPPPRIGEGAALSYTPEPAEQALIDALAAAAPRAAEAVEAERFADAMAALATLRAPIDRFFEEVIVNADEADKRTARLALLARFRDAVHRVADFSRIEG